MLTGIKVRCSTLTAIFMLLMIASTNAAPAAAIKVRVSQPNDIFALAPMYIAMQQGYFKNEGLDIELINSGSDSVAMAALFGGNVDILASASGSPMAPVLEGKKLIIFAQTSNQYMSTIVVSNRVLTGFKVGFDAPLTERIRALRGLRIGVTAPSSNSDLLLRAILKSAGLDPDRDAVIVNLRAGSTAVPALKTGSIDAISLASPIGESAVDAGLGKIWINSATGEVPSIRGMVFTVISATPDYLTRNREVAVRFARGLVRAGELLRSDRAAAAAALQAYFGTMPTGVFNVTFATVYPGLSTDPTPSVEGLRILQNILAQWLDPRYGKLQLGEIVDTGVVKEAKSTK